MTRLVLPVSLSVALATVLADMPQREAAAWLASHGLRLVGRGLL